MSTLTLRRLLIFTGTFVMGVTAYTVAGWTGWLIFLCAELFGFFAGWAATATRTKGHPDYRDEWTP